MVKERFMTRLTNLDREENEQALNVMCAMGATHPRLHNNILDYIQMRLNILAQRYPDRIGRRHYQRQPWPRSELFHQLCPKWTPFT